MKIHKFHKTSEGGYLFPIYARDDGKYRIASTDLCIGGRWRRGYVVTDVESGQIVASLPRLRDAKIAFEAD